MSLIINKKEAFFSLECFIVLFSCLMDIYIVNEYINYGVRLYLRFLLILIYFVLLFKRKGSVSKIFKLIFAFFSIVLAGSIINGYNIDETLKILTAPFLICLYVEVRKNDLYTILKYIKIYLSILVLIDVFTIFLYPNGMYFDGLYKTNWFLGYKTSRFIYDLPLCAITSFLCYAKRAKFGLKSYLTIALCCFTLFYSQSTAAFTALTLFGFLLFLIDFLEYIKIKGRKEFISCLFSYKVTIPIYIIAIFMVLFITYFPIIQKVVYVLFEKDATLTTRTFIWESCFKQFMQNPIIGIGCITNEEFIKITNNIYAGSAHSMIMTLLVSGGSLAIIFYFLICIQSLKKVYKGNLYIKVPFYLAVISLWFIGLTSSSLVYSAFGLFFYELLGLNTENNLLNDTLINKK